MDSEQKKKAIVKWGSIAAIGVVGLVVSPIIYFAIKGLFGLAVAAVMGAAVVFGAPPLLQKFANWKLKAMKSEAAANPIETFEREYTQRNAEIKLYSATLTGFLAELSTFVDQYEEF